MKKGEAKIRAKQKREISDIAEKKRDKGAFLTPFCTVLYCFSVVFILFGIVFGAKTDGFDRESDWRGGTRSCKCSERVSGGGTFLCRYEAVFQ